MFDIHQKYIAYMFCYDVFALFFSCSLAVQNGVMHRHTRIRDGA